MEKPRKNNAQSVIEFIVLFVIVAVTSVLLLKNIPNIFNTYVSNCAGAILQ